MKFKVVYSALLALTLVGCVDESKVTQLEQKISSLQEKNSSLEEAIKRIDFELKVATAFDGVAYLTPGATGYSSVRFDLGVLTIGIADIQPYANGSKVRLKFGNPLAATINGISLDADWGKVDDKGTPLTESAKTKSIEIVESLRPASWTLTTVVLEGVTPDQLGFVRIRNLTHKGIRLALPN